MIEIEFKANGKSLKELLQHMNMVETLIRLRIHDEKVTNYKNKGRTETSNYEWTISNEKNTLWIIGVAIRVKGSNTVWQTLKGSHSDLIMAVVEEGYGLNEVEHGFVLRNGTFLNRFEANKHVLKTGQLKEIYGSKLYSHELW